jgi:hypothetical protein
LLETAAGKKKTRCRKIGSDGAKSVKVDGDGEYWTFKAWETEDCTDTPNILINGDKFCQNPDFTMKMKSYKVIKH